MSKACSGILQDPLLQLLKEFCVFSAPFCLLPVGTAELPR